MRRFNQVSELSCTAMRRVHAQHLWAETEGGGESDNAVASTIRDTPHHTISHHTTPPRRTTRSTTTGHVSWVWVPLYLANSGATSR